MHVVPLDKNKHQRKTFDCGNEALNNYLKLMANQQSQKDNSRTYILEDTINKGRIVGFYTLSLTTVNLSSLPKHLQKKHPHSYTAGLLARLAVDKRYAGKGFGSWLLVDALKKLLLASDTVWYPMVMVDAKEDAKYFYEQFGFCSFLDEKYKLFMSISDIRSSFETQK